MNIQKIFELHLLWLNGDTRGKRANLSGANLSGTDLSRAILSKANLSGAFLSGANLYTMQFKRHTLYYTYSSRIKIGCYSLPIKQWLTDFKTIGKREGYTPQEIAVYGAAIKQCAKLQQKRRSNNA